ncbi:MAG: hypothetical protein N3G20_02835, partial [Verrucomicrobiae bacterium]|nr:hypothetical protein [Verrucomicrobiae bacterium]
GWLDPARDQMGLAFVYLRDNRWEDLAEHAQAMLKKQDTLEARLLLGTALDKLGKTDDMVALMFDTQRRYPDDFLSNLALAQALIRISGEKVVLAQATSLLLRAEKAAGRAPDHRQHAELLFLKGLISALDGQMEIARVCFKQVLEHDPTFLEALAALEMVDLGG